VKFILKPLHLGPLAGPAGPLPGPSGPQ